MCFSLFQESLMASYCLYDKFQIPRSTFTNPYQAYLITLKVQLPPREAGAPCSLSVLQQFQSWWLCSLYCLPLRMCLHSFPLMQKVQAHPNPCCPVPDLSANFLREWLSGKKAKYKRIDVYGLHFPEAICLNFLQEIYAFRICIF